MNEIEYSIERAQQWRRCFIRDGVVNHFEWCITTGLWETAGWVSDNHEDRSKIFEWFVPGKKTFVL